MALFIGSFVIIDSMTIYSHTPSAGGVIVNDGKLLVITSARRGTVDLPKGTVEAGESLDETALREVKEETGYSTRIVKDLGSVTYDYDGKDRRYRKTVSYFLMELLDSDTPEKNLQEGEDFENVWLTPDEAIAQLTYDDTRAIIQHLQANPFHGTQ